MLDNVLDVNFYKHSRSAAAQTWPIARSGWASWDTRTRSIRLRLPVASEAAVRFADESIEAVSFHAIDASVHARRRACDGIPPSTARCGARGVLPIDSIALLVEARGSVDVDRSATLDWAGLRERVKSVGMRNSYVMAIAPTATISNICGVAQSIEPAYQNLYVKANMSGDFIMVNPALVRDLKARALWDTCDGQRSQVFRRQSLALSTACPMTSRRSTRPRFEIDSAWLIEAAARRQKWIDQSQSLNLYIAEAQWAKHRCTLSVGVETRPQDHVLPAFVGRHPRRKNRPSKDRTGRLNAVAAAPSAPIVVPDACSLDDPNCEGLPVSGAHARMHTMLPTGRSPPPLRPARLPALAFVQPAGEGDATGLGAIDRGGGRVNVDDKAMLQLPRRREQPVAAEIPLGMGKISRRLQQSLDAHRGFHAGGHRAVEVAQWADRGRAARSEAQSRLLRIVGIAGCEQHRAGDLSPPDQSRMPPVPAAPGVRGRPSTPTPSNTSSRASGSTMASCSTCIVRCPRSPTRPPGR